MDSFTLNLLVKMIHSIVKVKILKWLSTIINLSGRACVKDHTNETVNQKG